MWLELIVASINGRIDEVRSLIAGGVNIDGTDERGISLFYEGGAIIYIMYHPLWFKSF